MTGRHPGAGQLVAINGRAAVRREIGGVERFAREMALRLPALRPDRYRVIAPPPPLAHGAGHLWEQFVLPLEARSAALLLSPANLAPILYPRNVAVIHDAAALSHPEAYSAAYVAYQRGLLPAIVARARLLVTVSEFSRRELSSTLGAAAERIIVIAEGVDERFTPSADAAPVRGRHGLTRPYVLAVGTASARKNPEALAAVAVALAERGVDLVLAGSGRGYLREEPAAGAAPVRRLGYVEEEDLPGLYAGADAFLMPSLYEGFGLPCLEAMASGVAVVATDAGALPETCGDAALLIGARETRGLVEAVLRVLDDEELRRRLIAEGRARASGFGWDRAAARLDAALASLLGSPGVR